MANTNTKKEDSSNPKAAQPITPACFNMLGMAMPPRVDAPVKNLAKFTQLLHHSAYHKTEREMINRSSQDMVYTWQVL
jgi:hypothetical protein